MNSLIHSERMLSVSFGEKNDPLRLWPLLLSVSPQVLGTGQPNEDLLLGEPPIHTNTLPLPRGQGRIYQDLVSGPGEGGARDL